MYIASSIERNQIKYVLLAAIIGFMGGVTNYPLWFGIKMLPWGNILVSVYVAIMAYAMVKHHLLDIRIAVSRVVVFSIVYGGLLGVPVFIGLHYGRALNKAIGFNWWLIPAGIIGILASIGPVVYSRLQKKLEDVLLAKQRRYQRILLQAAEGMIKIKEVKRLINLMVHILTKSVGIKSAGIFLYEEEDRKYKLESFRDKGKVKGAVEIDCRDRVIEEIKGKGRPFFANELGSKSQGAEVIRQIGSILIVPSQMQDKLIGFLVLGEKKDGGLFNSDDINTFQALSYQGTLAIENARFLEEFKRNQERIYHSEKLATIGAMADGVAHQINNRLQVFMAIVDDMWDVIKRIDKAGLSKEVREGLDYCQYCLDKMNKNIMHTAQIIRGVLNYARTERDSGFRNVDIEEMIRVAEGLLQVKHQVGEFRVRVEKEGKAEVWASPAQISDAIFNLIDNGYEAIKERITQGEDIEPQITVSVKEKGDRVEIGIRDNGIGIKEEDKVKIFAPFYTTKSSAISGTGLGMYVVKKIIEDNHKGRIWFKSEYKKGTEFYIELPAAKEGS